MRLRILALAALLAVPALAADAACYADYKAKRDGPLRLHYGVMQLPDSACSPAAAQSEAQRRLAAQGWTLLNVISIFGPEGLGERKANAGAHYLRY